jgi:two-component system CheB/CheR fusion protein
MESILSSLNAAVVVVTPELIVQVWNRQAEDMWGLREEETLGQHLLNLDSGMPTEDLKALVRDVIQGDAPDAQAQLRAVNRRGRAIQLRVAVTPLLSGGEAPNGALLVMEGREETTGTAA